MCFQHVQSLQGMSSSNSGQDKRNLGRLCLTVTWDMPKTVRIPTTTHSPSYREPLLIYSVVHTTPAGLWLPPPLPPFPNAHDMAYRTPNGVPGVSMRLLEGVLIEGGGSPDGKCQCSTEMCQSQPVVIWMPSEKARLGWGLPKMLASSKGF